MIVIIMIIIIIIMIIIIIIIIIIANSSLFSFSHEPSLARHLKSVVQILILILAHRPMAQWLPRTI